MPTRRRTTPDAAGLIVIYQCLCDETRLRILHLLSRTGQLCVCHFQGLLDKTQVQISKHLRYLKGKGLVESTKRANWMIYRLPAKRSAELDANLRCLQDCVQTHGIFKDDLKRLRKLQPTLGWLSADGSCGDPSPCSERAKRAAAPSGKAGKSNGQAPEFGRPKSVNRVLASARLRASLSKATKAKQNAP